MKQHETTTQLCPQPLSNAPLLEDLDDSTTSTLHFRPLLAVPEGFCYRTVAYDPQAPRLVVSAMDQMKGRCLPEPKSASMFGKGSMFDGISCRCIV